MNKNYYQKNEMVCLCSFLMFILICLYLKYIYSLNKTKNVKSQRIFPILEPYNINSHITGVFMKKEYES